MNVDLWPILTPMGLWPISLLQFILWSRSLNSFICFWKAGCLSIIVEEIFLCSLMVLTPLCENQPTIDAWIYSWILSSVLLLCIHIAISHHFEYCRLAVSFEIRNCNASKFVFQLSDCFVYPGHLQSIMDFRMSFPFLLKINLMMSEFWYRLHWIHKSFWGLLRT